MKCNLVIANNQNFEIVVDLFFETFLEAEIAFKSLVNGLCVGYHMSITYERNGSCECYKEVWK